MSTYTIKPTHGTKSQFYIGKETGALYIKATGGRYICLVPRNGSVQAGDWDNGGHHEAVPSGTVITINT